MKTGSNEIQPHFHSNAKQLAKWSIPKEKTFVLNPNIYYITSLQGCWLASLSIKLPPKDDLKTEDNFPLQKV